MKATLALLLFLIFAPPVHATALPPEPSSAGEVAALAGSAVAAAANMVTIANAAPSYWLGGVGVGLGVVALALSSQNHADYATGLLLTGTASVAGGLIALRYRYVLTRGPGYTRIEPVWHRGSAGVALVVTF